MSQDYDQQIQDAAEQYENGEIDIAEALTRTNTITAQQTAARVRSETSQIADKVNSHIEETMHQRDSQAVIEQFHRDNPDFQQMRDSGDLQRIMDEDPLADELTAFYKLKATQPAGASEPADTPQPSPTSNKPMNEAELKASMLAAIRDR